MCLTPGRAPFSESSLVTQKRNHSPFDQFRITMFSKMKGKAACSCRVQDVRDRHKRLAVLQRLHPDGVVAYPYFRVEENARSGVQAVLDQLHGRHVDSVNAEPDLGRFVERHSIDEVL